MRDLLVYGTELAVGIACLIAGLAARRRSNFVAILLGLAGLAAIGHALWAWILR